MPFPCVSTHHLECQEGVLSGRMLSREEQDVSVMRMEVEKKSTIKMDFGGRKVVCCARVGF
jgi:hypothetical protein